MKMMRGLSICAGIGGADLAAEMTGKIEIVGQVECEPFCLAVLEHYWPDVKRIERIQDVRGDEWGNIDICIAGIPCQPFSDAGRQRGSADERNLWPDMWRILSDQRERGEPYRWFVLENVKGLLHAEKGEFFKTIINDLATLGYRVGWCVYGACEVGAPHRRERVFVVAHYPGQRGRTWRTAPAHQSGKADTYSYGAPAGADVADTCSDGCRWRQYKQEPITRGEYKADTWQDGTNGIVADAIGPGPETTRHRTAQETAIGCGEIMANTCTQRSQERDRATKRSSQPAIVGPGERSAKSQMGRGASRFPDWLAGYSHRWPAGPDREQEAWEPPRIVQGRMPFRVAQIKALGNAIVPQQLAVLLREIVKVEEMRA